MNKTTNDESLKAVIYCRVSTKEQVDEGNSLVSQERLCREYAAKEGYEVIEAFIEKGESAKTTKRKELNRLMDFCTVKKGTIQVVIAYKIDRISRNMGDYIQIKTKLQKSEIVIKSVTEFFEDTPAGRFMENIIANVGQFDNDVRTERIIGGMLEATQEGRYVWTAPLGYVNAKVSGKSTIVQNDKAPLIKEVFERIAMKNESTDSIRVQMAEKGLLNRKGDPVTRSNFFWLLRNPLYKGKIKKFGKVYQGLFDPIVSEELFDDVQNILKGRMNKVKHYLHDNPDFPLRRFVVNEQGKQLTGYWSKGKRLKYPYYSFHLPGTTRRKELLENDYMEFLNRYSFDTTHLSTMRKFLIKHFENHSTTHKADGEAINKRIAEINGQIDNLIKLENAGNISTNIFKDRVKKFDYELDELKELLKKRKYTEVNVSQLLEFAEKTLKYPADLWRKSPLTVQKRLQVFDFPEGIIFDGIKFRTPKVCRIFKLKEQIDALKFSRVHSGYKGTNTLSKTKSPPSDKNLLYNKEFWQIILDELVELECIFTVKEKAPESENEWIVA